MDKQQREYIHHLMLQYSDAMVRLTYRRVGDWHLAEDLVQETFLTACCKSERVSSCLQKSQGGYREGCKVNLKDLLLRAKDGDQQAKEEIFLMYRPLLFKESCVNGIFDEDLFQELSATLIHCIRMFKL